MGRPRIWESEADRKADYRRRKREESEWRYLSHEADKMNAYRARRKGDTGPGSYAYDWELKKLLNLSASLRWKMWIDHRDNRLGWISSMLGELEFAMKDSKKLCPGLAAELDPLLKESRRVRREHPHATLALELACLFEDIEDRLYKLAGGKRATIKAELRNLPGYDEYRRKQKRQRKA